MALESGRPRWVGGQGEGVADGGAGGLLPAVLCWLACCCRCLRKAGLGWAGEGKEWLTEEQMG